MIHTRPDAAYLRDRLWLPISKMKNPEAVRNSLTFPMEDGTSIKGYLENDSHLLVPRMYIPYKDWDTLGFPVIDDSRMKFPHVQVESTCSMRNAVQSEAFVSLLEKGSGLLVLSCGAGKTVVSIAAWAKLKTPLLVVVHTKELMRQWGNRLLEHTTLRQDQIGVYQGTREDWRKPVCLSMIHTLAARAKAGDLPEGFRDHFGVALYDEVHHLGAPFFNATAAIGKGIRWGLSATPERGDGLDTLYQSHVGPVLYENLDQDEIPDTYFVQTGVTVPEYVWPSLKDRTGETNIPKLLTWLSKNEIRNNIIIDMVNEARKQGRKVLALSSRVAHIDLLADVFPEDSSKIHGSVKDSDREGALYKKDLIFASTQIAKEGLDRKDLDTVMLTLPITKEGMFRQIMGRIQRTSSEKQAPVLLVFEDEKISICRAMCSKLKRHLTAMKYPYYIDEGAP